MVDLLQKLLRAAERKAKTAIRAATAELAKRQRELDRARSPADRRAAGAALGRATQKLRAAEQIAPQFAAAAARDQAEKLRATAKANRTAAEEAATLLQAVRLRAAAERQDGRAHQLEQSATELAPTKRRKVAPRQVPIQAPAAPEPQPFFAEPPTITDKNGAEFEALGELSSKGGFTAEHLHLLEQARDWWREGATVLGGYQVAEPDQPADFYVCGVMFNENGQLKLRYGERQLTADAARAVANDMHDKYKTTQALAFVVPVVRGEQQKPQQRPMFAEPQRKLSGKRRKGNVAEQKRRARARAAEVRAAERAELYRSVGRPVP